MQADPDVVIVGGGLVGLAAVAALCGPANRTPVRVVLIDAGDPQASRKSAFDGRASAITETSRHMLRALGIWDAIEAKCQPMRRIIVTDSRLDASARPALLTFGETDNAGITSAYMVENTYLYAALHDLARDYELFTALTDEQVCDYSFDGASARVQLQSGKTLRAPLVVAADGRMSSARQAAHIETTGWSYNQCGITTTIAHELPHNGRAYEHFFPSGPFAVLPLPGDRSSLVWTEGTDDAKRIMAMEDTGFSTELAQRMGDTLGRITVAGPRHCHPLSMHVANSFVADRVALIGDAAHVVHPIAGLGFNLGLRDVAALAQVIVERARLGLDHGDRAALKIFDRWRRFDTIKTAITTDGLNKLFSNDNSALRQLRDTGLGLVNSLEPVKSGFMREAAGLSAGSPKLLAGQPI